MKVVDLAQLTMDEFYQTYKTDTDFFDLSDFITQCVIARNDLLEQEYIAARFKEGDMFVDPAWMRGVRLEIKYNESEDKFYADLPFEVFTFPLDVWGFGIQSINPAGSKCNFLKRIKLNQVWEICHAESMNNVCFYWQEGQKVKFANYPGDTTECVDTMIAQVIPASDCNDEETVIPDGKAKKIKDEVLQSMFRSYQIRLGKIIMADDKNPNPQGEQSGDVYKRLKTTE